MAEHTVTTEQTFEKIDDFAEFLGFFEEDDEFDNQLTDALDNVSIVCCKMITMQQLHAVTQS